VTDANIIAANSVRQKSPTPAKHKMRTSSRKHTVVMKTRHTLNTTQLSLLITPNTQNQHPQRTPQVISKMKNNHQQKQARLTF